MQVAYLAYVILCNHEMWYNTEKRVEVFAELISICVPNFKIQYSYWGHMASLNIKQLEPHPQ